MMIPQHRNQHLKFGTKGTATNGLRIMFGTHAVKAETVLSSIIPTAFIDALTTGFVMLDIISKIMIILSKMEFLTEATTVKLFAFQMMLHRNLKIIAMILIITMMASNNT